MVKILVRLVLGLAIGYALIGALMFFGQRKLQYHPDPSPMAPTVAKQETLSTPDGERIVTWWIAPTAPDAPVFLYLHGNGSNLMARSARLERLAKDGAGVLAVSWRGYGGSSGTPSEAGLRADARAAYDELARRVDASRIVIYGESLGTTVAVLLTAEVKSAALVLDSGFASALDIAQRRYPWLPVSFFLRDPFRADLAAPKVRVPVFQVHCAVDPVTSLESARALHALLPGSPTLQIVEDTCHVPPLPRYEEPLRGFLAKVFSRS